MTMPAIEITLDRQSRQWLMAIAVLVGIVSVLALGVLGRAVTPAPGRTLTWGDWQAFKLERQYRAELAALRNSAEQLAAALNSAPDPIRVGLLHDRLTQKHHTGVLPLINQRAAVLAANNAVYEWALASLSHEQAVMFVRVALDSLNFESPAVSSPRTETQ